MIFQDPMTSLNPVHQDRGPDRRADPGARGAPGPAGARAGDRAAREGWDPARARADRQLPVRVLGRHAPARDDRAGALVRPVRADRGRAHHRARRDDPGADPPAHARAARRDRRRDHPRDPRPRRGGRHRRPDRGHVLGADRGAGDARRDLLRPAAPVHVGAARVDRARGPAAARAAAGDRRACRPRSPTGPTGCHFRPRCPHEFSKCMEVPPLEARLERPARAPRPLLAQRPRRSSSGARCGRARSGWRRSHGVDAA